MRRDDEERIRAYLLRRMSEEAQATFEARLLEEPDLLHAVQRIERDFLSTGLAHRSVLRRRCALCSLGGAAAGAVLAVLAYRFLL